VAKADVLDTGTMCHGQRRNNSSRGQLAHAINEDVNEDDNASAQKVSKTTVPEIDLTSILQSLLLSSSLCSSACSGRR
jgi:hypothetical protein